MINSYSFKLLHNRLSSILFSSLFSSFSLSSLLSSEKSQPGRSPFSALVFFSQSLNGLKNWKCRIWFFLSSLFSILFVRYERFYYPIFSLLEFDFNRRQAKLMLLQNVSKGFRQTKQKIIFQVSFDAIVVFFEAFGSVSQTGSC